MEVAYERRRVESVGPTRDGGMDSAVVNHKPEGDEGQEKAEFESGGGPQVLVDGGQRRKRRRKRR